MKTLNEILETVIKRDAALNGYSPSTLPQAAKARIQNTLDSLERGLNRDELEVLKAWTGGAEIFKQAAADIQERECGYFVFGDGSLYFRSSGDSEVWSDATDFADKKIVNGYDCSLDEMDEKLLRHLGGSRYDSVISDRGVQS
jgi:hypothetical protein